MTTATHTIDAAAACTFIEALTQQPGGMEVACTWQTFDDNENRKKTRTTVKSLAGIKNGPLQHRIAELDALQTKGAGVFITVNETDLKGRSKLNIRRIRAVWADLDDKHRTAELDFQTLPIPPTIIVRSGHGLHLYWVLAEPSWELERAAALLKAIAYQLRDWGGDDGATDIARVLRLPGSLNLKDPNHPVRVELVQADPRLVCDLEDLELAFPAPEAKQPMMQPTARYTWADQLRGDDKVSQALRYFRAYPPAVEGEGGDHRTYRAATIAVRDFDLDDDQALTVLSEWNRGCVPPWGQEDLVEKIGHARKYARGPVGMKLRDPKAPPPSRKTAPAGPLFPGDQVPVDGVPEGASDAELVNLLRTEMGLADRFLKRYGNDVRWLHAKGTWLRWDGMRWKPDNLGVERLADQTARQLLDEARSIPDPEDRMKFLRYAHDCQRSAKRSSVLTLARSYCGVEADQLDADPYLLNCRNGVLDLRTGELKPHDRSLMQTKMVPVDYAPGAVAPVWDQFLKTSLGDADTVGFLQRFCGYSLTGDVSEQVVVFLHGGGSNGKSKFVGAIRSVLGDDSSTGYTATVPHSLLVGDGRDTHSTDVLTLMGARLAEAQELGKNSSWNEASLKRLSGGDVLRGRALYTSTHLEFRPSHKILVTANHLPDYGDATHSFRRRLQVVPFRFRFLKPGEPGFDAVDPKHHADEDLDRKLYAERQGILAWMVRGCLDWQARRKAGQPGLGASQLMLEMLAEYQEEQDTLGQFIQDCCGMKADKAFRVRMGALKKAYDDWAKFNGLPPMTEKAITQGIRDRLDWFQTVYGFPPSSYRDSRSRGWMFLYLDDSKANQGMTDQ